MTEIKVNFPQRATELTILSTDGKTSITDDFLLAYSILELNDGERKALAQIVSALADAKYRHPSFPLDKAAMLSVIGEEFGESCRAFNDCDARNLPVELSHAAATCWRALVAINAQEGNLND